MIKVYDFQELYRSKVGVLYGHHKYLYGQHTKYIMLSIDV